jgi:hypothetical protein
VLGFSGLLLGRRACTIEASRNELDRRFARYLVVLTLAPLLICIAMTAASGTGVRRMWGVPMLNLVGLLAISLTSQRFTQTALRRIAIASFALLVLIPTAYTAIIRLSPMLRDYVNRQNWPQAEIASRMRQAWIQSTGRPLRIVAGDATNWLSLALYAMPRLS